MKSVLKFFFFFAFKTSSLYFDMKVTVEIMQIIHIHDAWDLNRKAQFSFASFVHFRSAEAFSTKDRTNTQCPRHCLLLHCTAPSYYLPFYFLCSFLRRSQQQGSRPNMNKCFLSSQPCPSDSSLGRRIEFRRAEKMLSPQGSPAS